MAAYGVFVVAYCQFLLQSRLSDYIKQYNEPPRYRLHRNFAKSLFVGTRRMPGTEDLDLPTLKK